MATKYTLKDFRNEFPDDDACLEWLKNHLYPDGIHCPVCDRVAKHHRISSRKSYSCDVCGHHVHPTAGTIYHKSSTPLVYWFYAIFQVSTTRTGYAAKQLEREIGVTYKTAWRMLKKIREMLAETGDPFSGEVEVDETYAGNREGPSRRGRGTSKTPVFGAVERGGRIATSVVSDVTAKTLTSEVHERVTPIGTVVYSDEHPAYLRLADMGYDIASVRHGTSEWVRGSVHTNSIEGFWSNVKHGLIGVYRGVSRKYLQSYLDEYSFRYNRRAVGHAMFAQMMSQVQKSS